jgi:hypothetical protein
MPKQVITYETYDGKTFTDLEVARAHEDQAFARAVEDGVQISILALLESCDTVNAGFSVGTSERSVVENAVRRVFEASNIAK